MAVTLLVVMVSGARFGVEGDVVEVLYELWGKRWDERGDVTGQESIACAHLYYMERGWSFECFPHVAEHDCECCSKSGVGGWTGVVVAARTDGGAGRVVAACRVVEGEFHELGERDTAMDADAGPDLGFGRVGHWGTACVLCGRRCARVQGAPLICANLSLSWIGISKIGVQLAKASFDKLRTNGESEVEFVVSP